MNTLKVQPYVLILSGPAGSGKSTVATILWKELPDRPAYLDLDAFKNFIWQAPSDGHHLGLALRNALAVMRTCLDSGRSVIIDKAFGRYSYVEPFIAEATSRKVPVHYFKLTAPLNVLVERNRMRRAYSSDELMNQARWRQFTAPDESIEQVYRFCQDNAHPQGIEIDTARWSLSEVLDIVRAALHSAGSNIAADAAAQEDA
jgi:predicted kinase